MHYITLLMQYKPAFMLFMALIGWPFISALLNVLMRKKTAEEWEAWALQRPFTALLVELARVYGVDLKKQAVVLQRYAERKAGKIPEDALASGTTAVPASIAAILADPQKRALLEKAAEKLAMTGQSST